MSSRRTNRDPAATTNERGGDDAQNPTGSPPGAENAADTPERTDTMDGTASDAPPNDGMQGANFSATSAPGEPSHVGSVESDHAEAEGKPRAEAVLGADVTAANPGQAPHAQANYSPPPAINTKDADDDGVAFTQSQQRILLDEEAQAPATLATASLPVGSEPAGIDVSTGFPIRRAP